MPAIVRVHHPSTLSASLPQPSQRRIRAVRGMRSPLPSPPVCVRRPSNPTGPRSVPAQAERTLMPRRRVRTVTGIALPPFPPPPPRA
jgi:hypothetical protein